MCVRVCVHSTVRIWDYTQDACINVLSGHTAPVRGLMWNTEVPYLLISGNATKSTDLTLQLSSVALWSMCCCHRWATRVLACECLSSVIPTGQQMFKIICHISTEVIWFCSTYKLSNCLIIYLAYIFFSKIYLYLSILYWHDSCHCHFGIALHCLYSGEKVTSMFMRTCWWWWVYFWSSSWLCGLTLESFTKVSDRRVAPSAVKNLCVTINWWYGRWGTALKYFSWVNIDEFSTLPPPSWGKQGVDELKWCKRHCCLLLTPAVMLKVLTVKCGSVSVNTRFLCNPLCFLTSETFKLSTCYLQLILTSYHNNVFYIVSPHQFTSVLNTKWVIGVLPPV